MSVSHLWWENVLDGPQLLGACASRRALSDELQHLPPVNRCGANPLPLSPPPPAAERINEQSELACPPPPLSFPPVFPSSSPWLEEWRAWGAVGCPAQDGHC